MRSACRWKNSSTRTFEAPRPQAQAVRPRPQNASGRSGRRSGQAGQLQRQPPPAHPACGTERLRGADSRSASRAPRYITIPRKNASRRSRSCWRSPTTTRQRQGAFLSGPAPALDTSAIGLRITALVDAQGITVSHSGLENGSGKQEVCRRFALGRKLPDGFQLRRIAEFFKVTPEEILGVRMEPHCRRQLRSRPRIARIRRSRR